jgi:hypothetical protein
MIPRPPARKLAAIATAAKLVGGLRRGPSTIYLPPPVSMMLYVSWTNAAGWEVYTDPSYPPVATGTRNLASLLRQAAPYAGRIRKSHGAAARFYRSLGLKAFSDFGVVNLPEMGVHVYPNDEDEDQKGFICPELNLKAPTHTKMADLIRQLFAKQPSQPSDDTHSA